MHVMISNKFIVGFGLDYDENTVTSLMRSPAEIYTKMKVYSLMNNKNNTFTECFFYIIVIIVVAGVILAGGSCPSQQLFLHWSVM